MSTSLPIAPPERTWVHRIGRRVLSIAAVMFFVGPPAIALVGYAAFRYWAASGEARAEAELASIRAAGDPTTGAELAVWLAPAAGEPDATQAWLDALARFDEEPLRESQSRLPLPIGDEELSPVAGQPWQHEAAVRALLAEQQPALDALRHAAQQPGGVRYPRANYSIEAELSHFKTLDSAARMLGHSFDTHLYDGQIDAALDDLYMLDAAARSLEHEPLLVGQLMFARLAGLSCRWTQRLLGDGRLSDEQLVRAGTPRVHDFHRAIKVGLIGDRVAGLIEYGKLANAGWFGATRGDDKALYLRTLAQLEEASQLPWPEALDRAAAIDAEYQAHFVSQSKLSRKLVSLRYSVAAVLTPSVDVVLQAGASIAWSEQAVKVLIALERFRRSEGHVPAALAELTPAYLHTVPFDPFDARPMRYRVAADEAILWCIGPDHIEDDKLIDEYSVFGYVLRLRFVKPESGAPGQP